MKINIIFILWLYYMFYNNEIAEFEKSTNIDLEPRLVEYIKKKQFCKENNIKDPLIEKEYGITKNDLEKLTRYKKTQVSFEDYIDTRKHKNKSILDRPDKRLEKIKEKQRRDTDANKQRNNYDIMTRKYDMYREDVKFSSASGNDFQSRFDPGVWFENHDEYNDTNPNIAKITDMRKRYANTNVYTNKPSKISYKNYLPHGSNIDSSPDYSLDEIIGKLDEYKKMTSCPYSLKTTTRNEEDRQCMEEKDSNTDNYLTYGSGQIRVKKSRGYPNPVEHYFNYISDDIQDPAHVVLDPGMPSRMFNKDIPRQYKIREIM